MTTPSSTSPALAAVRAEHRPDGGIDGPGAMCVTCTPGFGTPAEDPVPYPCPPLGRALLADGVTADLARAIRDAADRRGVPVGDIAAQLVDVCDRDGYPAVRGARPGTRDSERPNA